MPANQISSLPADVFSGLSSLKLISLFDNQLTTFPAGIFSGLTSLTEIDFRRNQLSILPAGIFSGLSSLTTIRLDSNQLSILPAGIFSGLSSLTTIGFEWNQLNNLSAGIFSGLSSLTTIGLGGNQLSNLPTGLFSGLSSLVSISLYRNQLSSLPEGLFSGLSSLTTLNLSDNAAELSLIMELQQVRGNQFKAVIAIGAPFTIVVPLNVTNGSIMGGAITATIPIGSVESAPFTVIPTVGTSDAVTLQIGTLPNLPSDHRGYTLAAFNLAPEFVEGPSMTRTVAEDIHTGGYIGTAVSATDPYNDPLTYTLSGADASSFAIDATTGQLRTSVLLDYETQSTYTVTVNVTDGTLTSSITVTINVTDVEPEALNVGEPRTVRLFYLLPNDRPYRPEVVQEMKTGVLEVQSFYAEQMAAHGHGNKTFRIETDAQGVPIVHRVDGKYPDSVYSRGYTEGEIAEAFDNSENITLIVIDVSRETYSGVQGIGTGTKQNGWAIFYREWDWFIGSHELGHAFGLHHDSRDDADILSYGRRNSSSASLSACAADFLAVHPYFNSDVPLENESPPTVELISPTLYPQGAGSVPIRLRVRDDDGLHQVILFVNTKRSLSIIGPEVKACRGLAGETDTIVEFNYDGKTPSDRVFSSSPTSFSDPLRHGVYVVAVDTDGNRTDTFAPMRFTLEEGVAQEIIIPLSDRTPQVRDAIIAAVPDANSSSDVVAADLAEITGLSLNNKNITSLKAGDFDGLSALQSLNLSSNSLTTLPEGIFDGLSTLVYLNLDNNSLTTLPEGIFDGLSALQNLSLGSNSLTTLPEGIFDGLSTLRELSLGHQSVLSLPLIISLEKVGDDQFKAVAPTGAPFEIVLPITVTNGSISGGTTSLTIPAGSVESDVLTVVTRTPGTTAAVTVDIGTLPSRPANHSGYSLVKSDDLPITVIGGDIADESVLTLTVGAGPGAALRGYNPHSLPDWNFGTLSSPTFVLNGVSYTLYRLYYSVAGKRLDFQTSPMLRGFELHLDSHLFRSFSALDYNLHQWNNVNLNWSVGQQVRVRVVETTPMPPGAPTNLTATPSYERVTLSWIPPANADPIALPITEYEYRISVDGGNTWDPDWETIGLGRTGHNTLTSCTFGDRNNNRNVDNLIDINLTNGTSYTFEIRARGGDGSGDAARITVVPDGSTPVSERTPQVRDAIVAAVPGVNSANDITEAHLTAITSLYLLRDNITTLKASDFDGLTALTTLDLAENQLSTLPEGIFDDLTALTTLELHGNQLSTLPQDIFDGLTKLRELQLHNNQLSTLSADVFEGLSRLDNLFLQGNQLTTLPAGIFDKQTVLRTLNLEGNQLSMLPEGIFNKLTELNYLTLADNQLTTLPAGIFDGPSALYDIWLDGNQFTTLPMGIFKMKASYLTLRKLYLEDNAVDPLPLTVSLEKVAEGQFKAVAPAGAPFNFALQISIANGTINGGTTTLTIPKGSVESDTLTVIRTAGMTDAVTVDIGTLPQLPTSHQGYALLKSADLPLEVISADTTNIGTQETAVNIPDPNLRTKIETTLGKTSGDPISAAEMATLTSLTAQDARITNLTGLETATNLTTLKLGNNTISNISALSGLTSLTELHLWDNQLSNISALSGLTNLIKLYLWGNNISDISHLSGLTSLTQLRIGENSISNISAVSSLRNLTYLSVKENAISNISAVSGLTNLTELLIGNNTISDITPVQNLTQLVWLDMPNNQISDISAVQNLTQLVELYFKNNAVSDLSLLVTNTGLGTDDELDMRGNPLSYPSIYTHIPALQARSVYVDFDNRVTTAPVKISGDTQQGNTGATLAQPFVVEVRDASSVAFAGVPVTFAVTAGGGALSATNTTTDVNGRAKTTLTLGNIAGTNTVRVSVEGISTSVSFTATSTTANIAPVFTDGTNTTRTIAENTAANISIGTAITATDTDNDTLTYTLGGTDAAAFNIDSNTGQLKTKSTLDYETKATYTVTVSVSDGSLTDTITVIINVTDIDELITSTAVCQVGDVLAPGASCTYPGTDVEFSVNNNGIGQFLFFTAGNNLNIKDTEINGVSYTLVAKKLASGSWQIEEIADNTGTGTTNTAPVFTDGTSTTRTIAENTAANANIGTAITATDADNDSLTYTLGGTDAAAFTIDSTTGQLKTNAPLDYETKFSYTVTITVSDGSLTDTITVTIYVTDVNDTSITSALTPVCDRTPQVRDAIVAAVPGVNDCNDVTEAHLATITHLDLENKNILTLKDGDFDGLSALTELRLQENQLTTLPANIFSGLSALKTLYLNNNQLTSLPTTVFSGLSSLSNLYMNNNKLTSLPETVFSGLTSLRQINMHTNQLTTLPVNVFSGLSSLNQISINNNRLISLPENVFSGRTKLVYLYLDGNRLTSLPANLFSGLSKLEQLKFNHNRLSSLPAGLFSGLSSLSWLLIHNNTVNPLPFTVSLEKIGTNQFKAIAPVGAPFTMIIPITVVNGSISGGASTLTIPAGSVESQSLTVTRIPGTTAAVTVDIGTLPGLPANHQGYEPTKSADLPLTIISSPGNNAPVFTDGTNTTRTIAENTAANISIGTAITATDADNDPLTYTLGGTDASAFDIDTTSGQLQTKAVLDYETKSAYTITITVFDGSLTDTIDVTINITDIDELPTTTGICKVGDILAPGESCTYPDTDAVFSVLDNGNSKWNIRNLPWFDKVSIGGSMSFTADINNENYHFVAKAISGNSWEIEEIGDDTNQQPDTPEQPGATSETSTLSVSTAVPLTEATLPEGVVTLRLSSGTFERSIFKIRNAITLTGISGVTVDTFGVDRVSDTQVTVELAFNGNMTTDSTLTIAMGTGAIADYEGVALTVQIPVTAVTEAVVASTAAPLAEATLDKSIVTLTLSGRKFESLIFKIRGAVTVSGISGVTTKRSDVDRVSDTEITVELTFNGNLNTDGTLTFTVGARAIAGYNGPALTAQVSVSASEAPGEIDDQPPETPQNNTPPPATDTRTTFEASTPPGYTRLTLKKTGSVWGIPTKYTTDSDVGTVAYMLLAKLTDCGFADAEVNRRDIVYIKRQSLGRLNNFASESVCGKTSSVWSDAWNAVRITHLRFFDETSLPNIKEAVYNPATDQIKLPSTWQPPDEPTINDSQDPDPSEQPGENTDRTPTPTTSTTAPLTEATLNGGVITLSLDDQIYELSVFKIRNAMSVAGIPGVTIDSVERVSDMEIAVALTFNGNIDTDATLTFTVDAGAIVDYTGPAFTAQTSVPAVTESIVASTAAPLTEAALDESIITLTLSGRKYERWNSTIRPAVSVSGISGVTVGTFDIDRESDMEITVELTFDGDITTDGTLTFTVGAGAIAGYNGPTLTAQVSVSASTDAPDDTTPVIVDTTPVVDDTTPGVCKVGDVLAPSESCTYPGTDTEFSVLGNGNGQFLFFTSGSSLNIKGTEINGESYTLVAKKLGSGSWEIEEIGDSGGQQPVTPEQPETLQQPDNNTGGTPTLSVTTATPLTEATLHEGIITLTLSDGTFERSKFTIRDAITLTGITGVTVDTFGVDRVSDTQVTVELEFNGNITTNGTLTVSVAAGAIKDYDGTALTSQLSVTAVSERIVASTAAPLAEATLDESVVSLTLSGRNFESSSSKIRGAVTVSTGIAGVTVGSFGVRRVSDTKVTVELEFEGTDFDTTSTLTFTVGANAIAGYNGPALTAQISVTANTESVVASSTSPLTEATLDESIVTLTLSGGTFERSSFKIRDAVTVSGIAGVTVGTFDIDRVSDTQITVELTFDGNINVNSTLTFTVGADAIVNYSGSALTAQVSVTANRENVLLANFPNPFNPETWIPYQLDKPAEVTISIYAVDGQVVRRLALGHQPAGMYQNRSRAAYWDGRNEFGESVASGIYFYTLTAGEFNATRKMLITK